MLCVLLSVTMLPPFTWYEILNEPEEAMAPMFLMRTCGAATPNCEAVHIRPVPGATSESGVKSLSKVGEAQAPPEGIILLATARRPAVAPFSARTESQ